MGLPAFPHLDTLRDPSQMRAVFQQYLLGGDQLAVVVATCAVDLVRQASARCLLQYTLQLEERDTRRQRTQVVTGVTYSGNRTRQVWGRMQSSGTVPTRPVPGSMLPPMTYIPELQVLIQVFPYDFHLPALARLVQQPPAEVVSLIMAAVGPGDWDLE